MLIPTTPNHLKLMIIIKSFKSMVSYESIIHHLIALGLCFLGLTLLSFPALFPHLGKYHTYLTYLFYTAAVLQFVKSATESLFMPLLCLIAAGVGLLIEHYGIPASTLAGINPKTLMLMGVVGLLVSVYTLK